MKISVITASIRPEMVEIVEKCLKRQTLSHTSFEWILIGPKNMKFKFFFQPPFFDSFLFIEPKKREGDYYNLNKAWNKAFKYSIGELIVIICDGLWFEPDLLEKLWNHYESNPKAIVGAIGNQYDQIINGKPEHMVWQDPRARTDMGSFYATIASEIEWCIVSFPKQAIFDVGGVPEDYDRGAALSEKITNLRFEKAGYQLFLSQSIEYRAIQHPRLSPEWDEKYKIASDMYSKDVKDILEGKKLKIDYLKQ